MISVVCVIFHIHVYIFISICVYLHGFLQHSLVNGKCAGETQSIGAEGEIGSLCVQSAGISEIFCAQLPEVNGQHCCLRGMAD